jgi:SAM-dependent methyltransferase
MRSKTAEPQQHRATVDVGLSTEACAVCRNTTGNRPFVAREMMFGWRHEFAYLECSRCGCVQLRAVPHDLYRYYPPDYYPALGDVGRESALKTWLVRERAKFCLVGTGLAGRLLATQYGRPSAGIFGRPDYYSWLRKCGVTFSSAILEVGCGSGELLTRLWKDGFSNLTGIDPFITASRYFNSGFEIRKEDVFSVATRFDLVMLHHTFEHMPDPITVLTHVASILKRDGHVVIRIPVAGSFAHRYYGANWAQLDAPRHLFLHTPASLREAARRAGLRLADVVFDSDEFQFWASEQYARDIPLKSAHSYATNPRESLFSDDDIKDFRNRSRQLNKTGDGDSACFYLSHD